MRLNMNNILNQLLQERKIFHSEADFQHALAWVIHGKHPSANIRLEFPFSIRYEKLHLDISITAQALSVAIELKYKTRLLKFEYQNEQFNLSDHGGQPGARYDFIKDIQRLEHFKNDKNYNQAFAIFLTNDSSYWSAAIHENTIDQNFRLNENEILHGRLSWSRRAARSTIKGRESSLLLDGRYSLNWQDYSNLGQSINSKFRALVVSV